MPVVSSWLGPVPGPGWTVGRAPSPSPTTLLPLLHVQSADLLLDLLLSARTRNIRTYSQEICSKWEAGRWLVTFFAGSVWRKGGHRFHFKIGGGKTGRGYWTEETIQKGNRVPVVYSTKEKLRDLLSHCVPRSASLWDAGSGSASEWTAGSGSTSEWKYGSESTAKSNRSVSALKSKFRSLGGPRRSQWRRGGSKQSRRGSKDILSQTRITLKSRIRIRIKVKIQIRNHINVMRIRNTITHRSY